MWRYRDSWEVERKKDELLEIVNICDTNYTPVMSSALDLTSGKHMKKTLLNIDLLWVSDVLFEPSFLGSDQMVPGEILKGLLTARFDMVEVFLIG